MTVGERLCTNPLATTWATALVRDSATGLPTRTTTPAVGGSGNNDMEPPSKKLKHCLVSW
jgi:hypothetical protein